ncbi:dienelactone hydrolase family protein [Pseudonocardia sp. HH130630-07]|uniref:dienelactone hydrolase family protein n=1 Tax=Pseudonocardia sp. HH130630-07 TaxID=1690815 RepID=UPI000B1BC40D|nr:dienelactone hydrolase family protein [Pseudonocardia sp. HH130630-07]
MTGIVVLHHALGRTAGVLGFAEALTGAGHEVTVPDLFAGRTFGSVADGVAHAASVGSGVLLERAESVLATLPPEQVLLGFSLGVVPAQQLAATRPGVLGAVLCHACLPPPEPAGWPAGVPVRVHAGDADPYFDDDGDADAARALLASAADGALVR